MGSHSRIAVTGGAGQIAYSLLFRLAKGELLPGQTLSLHILEVSDALPCLEGVRMELQDAAFPLLHEIIIGSDPWKVFEGVNYAFLVGAKPRLAGMERKELLGANGKIFQEQGKALSDVAARDVRTLVVGNPCNTNCLIALHNAKNIAPNQFQAMTRLDQNRAAAYLAEKAAQPVSCVKKMTIWGNHSSTQVPDFYHAEIAGKPAHTVISDMHWLENDFIKKVQNRGAEIIRARGKSSAASAASSAIDAMRAVIEATESNDWFSAGVYTQNNSYGIDSDLVFSFPCEVSKKGSWQEVKNVVWNDFLRDKIRLSEKELIEERELIRELL